jgi:hypothetical protein
MAKKHLSRDQKRKAKLAKRAAKQPKASPLAYTGNKYKTDELTDVYLATETGIYEAFVMTQRQLTDDLIEEALEGLVLQMREGDLLPLEPAATVEVIPGQEADLVRDNVRRNWEHLFERRRHPGKEQVIGVLRTLLGSINVWRTPGKSSRGYLHYLEGFLRKAGVSVTESTPAGEPLGEPADQLLELGRVWCVEGDDEAAHDFRAEAERLLRSGEVERVGRVCRQLMGEATDNPRVIPELSALALAADNSRSP